MMKEWIKNGGGLIFAVRGYDWIKTSQKGYVQGVKISYLSLLAFFSLVYVIDKSIVIISITDGSIEKLVQNQTTLLSCPTPSFPFVYDMSLKHEVSFHD